MSCTSQLWPVIAKKHMAEGISCYCPYNSMRKLSGMVDGLQLSQNLLLANAMNPLASKASV